MAARLALANYTRPMPPSQRAPSDPEALAVNMTELRLNGEAAAKDKKKQDTLFGPNVGILGRGPEWTLSDEKQPGADELTVETVKSWIAKSKEPSQPTTTLQALVNLKRPTIRLIPIQESDEEAAGAHNHALEFEFDCDAPKCDIDVTVVLPDHRAGTPAGDAAAASTKTQRVNVFHAVVDSGFGRRLKMDDGAILELGQFEHSSAAHHAADTSATSDPAAAPGPAATDAQAATDNSAAMPPGAAAARKRRFSSFHFRRRTTQNGAGTGGQMQPTAAGPALAVVDAEAAPPANADGETPAATHEDAKDAKEGVRIVITLSAVDTTGAPLAAPNTQTTYLHVVRFGQAESGAAGAEDTRPWVVRVVKREARIGPHTFQLHEIFGLSSHTHTAAAVEPAPAPDHSYPPAPAAPAADEEPSSECLLCLSSPREVVLLPCRHLVACRECAVNMVEFGAGGNIVQAEEPVAAPAGADAAANGEAGAEGAAGEGAANGEGAAAAATPAPAPAPPAQTRRKRKAKGWFCPVCRQPYTSLLRITTSPPTDMEKPADATKDATAAESPVETPSQPASGGPLASLGRPGFLRGLSLGRNTASTTLPPDVERQ